LDINLNIIYIYIYVTKIAVLELKLNPANFGLLADVYAIKAYIDA
jgi:hypothetical protein